MKVHARCILGVAIALSGCLASVQQVPHSGMLPTTSVSAVANPRPSGGIAGTPQPEQNRSAIRTPAPLLTANPMPTPAVTPTLLAGAPGSVITPVPTLTPTPIPATTFKLLQPGIRTYVRAVGVKGVDNGGVWGAHVNPTNMAWDYERKRFVLEFQPVSIDYLITDNRCSDGCARNGHAASFVWDMATDSWSYLLPGHGIRIEKEDIHGIYSYYTLYRPYAWPRYFGIINPGWSLIRSVVYNQSAATITYRVIDHQTGKEKFKALRFGPETVELRIPNEVTSNQSVHADLGGGYAFLAVRDDRDELHPYVILWAQEDEQFWHRTRIPTIETGPGKSTWYPQLVYVPGQTREQDFVAALIIMPQAGDVPVFIRFDLFDVSWIRENAELLPD